jgi:hypothetical protein
MNATERKCVAQRLVGRTITRVIWYVFDTKTAGVSRTDRMSQQPILVLDDGTRVAFMTDETEVGEYGTTIIVSRKP